MELSASQRRLLKLEISVLDGSSKNVSLLRWSLLPFGVKLTKDLLQAASVLVHHKHFKGAIDLMRPDDVAAVVGLEADRFFARSWQVLAARSKNLPVESLKIANRNFLWIAGVNGLFAALKANPAMMIVALLQFGRFYGSTTYYRDLEQQAGISPKDKNVVMLIDRQIIAESGSLPFADKDDPTGLSKVDDVAKMARREGNSFLGIPVGTIEEFNAATKVAEQTTNAFLIMHFHGDPGEFFISGTPVTPNLDQIEERNCTNTTGEFLSCLTANVSEGAQYDQRHALVALGNKLHTKQVVGSLRLVGTYPLSVKTPVTIAYKLIKVDAVEALERFLKQGSGVYFYDEMRSFIKGGRAQNHAVGFVVYESGTSELKIYVSGKAEPEKIPVAK